MDEVRYSQMHRFLTSALAAALLTWAPQVAFASTPTHADFDGDGKTDMTVYRPSTGEWYVLQSSTAFATHSITQWGLAGDQHVNGDFDGDGKPDFAIYRRNPGQISEWFILLSSTGYTAFTHVYFGLASDVPVPADYDGDGKTDIAVHRAFDGTWHVLRSSVSGSASYVTYANPAPDIYPSDYPVPADFDGDGKADLVVYRRTTGMWYMRLSSGAFSSTTSKTWGTGIDRPVPADYDGDGKADLAVYRPSTGGWLIQPSSGAPTISESWGLPGDITTPGDYDGDGKTDLAVYRPQAGTWYVLLSTTDYSSSIAQQWGLTGDLPVPGAVLTQAVSRTNRMTDTRRSSDFDGDGRSDIAVYRPSSGTWYVLQSTSEYQSSASFSWGLEDDNIVPGDYDGDGLSDAAVWRPTEGRWYIRGLVNGFQWGVPGDIPIPGDYDGSGIDYIAVYRPSSTTHWWLTTRMDSSRTWCKRVGGGSVCPGATGDVPVVADYDGDGIDDLAVYTPSTGMWTIDQSGVKSEVIFQLGAPGDIPVPGDYDGDGAADIAVFRPSTGQWLIRLSSTGYATTQTYTWGVNGDIPVPGDFDGDGITDIAVWHPPTGVWSILQSSTNFTQAVPYQWGLPGDIPILPRQ